MNSLPYPNFTAHVFRSTATPVYALHKSTGHRFTEIATNEARGFVRGKKNRLTGFHCKRCPGPIVTCFRYDYRHLAEIPAGKQPINPWARSPANKMTARNVSCRVLQPVPRIIDPRKIYDSIGPASSVFGMDGISATSIFPFFPFLSLFLSRHEYVAKFRDHDKLIGSNCKHCTGLHHLTLDLPVPRNHTDTRW